MSPILRHRCASLNVLVETGCRQLPERTAVISTAVPAAMPESRSLLMPFLPSLSLLLLFSGLRRSRAHASLSNLQCAGLPDKDFCTPPIT